MPENVKDWIVNPTTNRLIKIGSPTYRRLVNQGVIKNTWLDDRVLAHYGENDDVEQLKHQLCHRLHPNEIISRGKGRYKGKLIRTYKGSKGRPKKANPEPEVALEEWVSNILTSQPVYSESDSETDSQSESGSSELSE